MTKTPDRFRRSGKAKDRVCRVAYTINNEQPVLCTLIGDEPLFYMDYESAWADEDRALDAFEAEGFDPVQTEYLPDDEDADPESGIVRMERFLVDAFDIGTPSELRISFPESRIDDIVSLIEKSRFGGALYGHARIRGIAIEAADHVERSALDLDSQKIFIHPRLGAEDAALCAVRELRRFWQKSQGALIQPLAFHPDQAILVNRAQQADLDVAVVRAAWEMQLSGARAPWDLVETSSLADLARTFAREAFLDFRTLNNGEAAAAAFESWFLSERCRRLDKLLIQQMLADYSGVVFGGEPMAHTVAAQVVAALGSVPFGKNYLEPHARMILTDPVFTEVRDRANANFLWFIKFEKSFREAEQELQQESGLPAASFSAGPQTQNSRNAAHEPEIGNVVVPFPQRPASGPSTRRKRSGNGGASAEVIFLHARPNGNRLL